MRQACPDARQQDIAREVGMTPDAFSRALRGQRNFSPLELARLADLLNTDLYWLITGETDPHRLSVVPRCASDAQAINDIALAYRQGYPRPGVQRPLPASADAARAALGHHFVRLFADRLERTFGIDVVRIRELSAAYAFAVGNRRVIAVPATGDWCWGNWSGPRTRLAGAGAARRCGR